MIFSINNLMKNISRSISLIAKFHGNGVDLWTEEKFSFERSIDSDVGFQ